MVVRERQLTNFAVIKFIAKDHDHMMRFLPNPVPRQTLSDYEAGPVRWPRKLE
jgi:hypothetical protein